ncbi:MAG TPA: multidrug efflux RND transporter permease subunit [Myxococcota bacterium]|nr:multidrug efflux RND transporter permease subunit [Myxococcota bacterium]
MVDFFIGRPVFAAVLAILITFAGAVCLPFLPVAQFPRITPPTVRVSASYPGASAEVVENSVTVPLEQQINGVEGMLYMSSNSSNDGSSAITVTFEVGYDLNIAAVDVQNRVAVALPQLPEEVQRAGLTVRRVSTDLTIVVNLISPDNSRDDVYLSNYAGINISDRLKRLPGVGDVATFGERKYSMRVWLDPDKLAKLGVTAQDVIGSLREQNQQVAAGVLGQPPAPAGQTFQFALTAKGRLTSPEEFSQIVLRTRPDGSVLRLGDVARVELGAQSYLNFSRLGREASTGIAVFALPSANALDVATRVHKEMERLSPRFPAGVKYLILYEPTRFVTESIREVVWTLFEAMLLVFLVVYVFLESFRATLIPAITVPVSLVGTFALMAILGFSVNTLSLFGLVLAIGLVVDDAIVVVENVSRLIEERGLPPREATVIAMREVTAPIVAISLVLMAVFLPVAFLPGTTGRLYQQFALTIAFSVAISAFNALTLSPALCAVFLRRGRALKSRFFQAFDRAYERFVAGYERVAETAVARWPIVVGTFAVLIGVTVFLYDRLPTSFLPDEDQGYFIVSVQLPDGSSLQRTEGVTKEVVDRMLAIPGVASAVVNGGTDFLTGAAASNAASCYIVLKPWDERKASGEALWPILDRARKDLAQIPSAVIVAFNAPPIRGLGTTGGFQLQVQDETGGDYGQFAKQVSKLIDAANASGKVSGVVTGLRASIPQYAVDIDRTKAKTLGLSLSDVFGTLETYLGGYYVNDFNIFGRVFRVVVQAEPDARARPDDVTQLYARNAKGDMVPLSTLAGVRPIVGPSNISHYNLFRTALVTGSAASGRSSGQAIRDMEVLANQTLPEGASYEWTGLSLQELRAGGTAPFVFGLALIVVFLCLAALYESWVLPFTIMLVVPLAVLGALLAQYLRGLANDVFCQVGLVMLVGLASKNAILVVEFAQELRKQGESIERAALHAARVRLRPILMTSFAFILGVVPLVIASGAGAMSRRSLGTAVFGGMLLATFLSLGVVPVFYVVIERIRERVSGARRHRPPVPAPAPPDSLPTREPSHSPGR